MPARRGRRSTGSKAFEGAHWAAVWADAAAPFETRGREREAAGEWAAARDAYFAAYGLLHVGRFPTPNHPGEIRELPPLGEATTARAGRFFSPPVEVIDLPFVGKTRRG